jgi:uncharacterized protein (TIGR02117 family)
LFERVNHALMFERVIHALRRSALRDHALLFERVIHALRRSASRDHALAVLLAGWVTGCAGIPTGAALPAGEATIYVVGRGWHTDIGLPVEEVAGPLASLERDFPGVRFMVFGFGERDYYIGRSEGSGEMLTALFPSKSAILLTALRVPPTEAFESQQVVLLHLSRAGVERIVARLWDGLEKREDGSAVRLAEGPYPGSAFYASSETYDALHTCNTWTARMLREGGVPVNVAGVLFTDQVMRQVRWIAAGQARAP